MSRLAVSSIVLLLVFAAGAEGAMLLEKSDIDLGFIYRDQPQKMVFPFENASRDTVHILSIEPSCDCTTAQVMSQAIPPRGTGELHVFFDPMGYESRGRVKESVRLLTSDRQDPEVLVTFAIEVGIGPEPEPRSLAFGRVAKGASDTLRLVIRPGKMGPSGKTDPSGKPGASGRPEGFAIVGARSDNDKMVVTQLGKTADGGNQLMVIVTNKSGGGEVAGFVTIETSDSLRQEIRVPVTASLPGSIAVEPGIIAFGPTLPGKYIAQTLKISSDGNLRFTIESVTSSVSQLDFEVRPIAQNAYELKIKVKDGAPAGRLIGEMRIRTDRPDQPTLDVKVTGYVRSTK